MGTVSLMCIEAPAFRESGRSTATPHISTRRARPRLYVSLVQTRRIPYPLMRDGRPGARAVDAARDVSRSVHHLLRSPLAPDPRTSLKTTEPSEKVVPEGSLPLWSALAAVAFMLTRMTG